MSPQDSIAGDRSDSSEIRPEILVIPVGSWEQHGPHLPFDTDTRIAQALAEQLLQRYPHFYLGPAITVSASGEHAGFLGTLSIGTETTAQILIEIVRSASWSAGIVFVNGHGGNHDALHLARRMCLEEGRRVLFWSPPADDDRDTHAGHSETSVMMVVAPDTVRVDRLEAGVQAPLAEILPRLRTSGVIGVSPNGVLGDPRQANISDGRRLLDVWSDSLHTAVETWLGQQ